MCDIGALSLSDSIRCDLLNRDTFGREFMIVLLHFVFFSIVFVFILLCQLNRGECISHVRQLMLHASSATFHRRSTQLSL